MQLSRVCVCVCVCVCVWTSDADQLINAMCNVRAHAQTLSVRGTYCPDDLVPRLRESVILSFAMVSTKKLIIFVTVVLLSVFIFLLEHRRSTTKIDLR